MHYDAIPKINEDIKRTKRAIIGLGCSFVEGQGAIDQYLWDNYYQPGSREDYNNWKLDNQIVTELITKFPDLQKQNGGSGSIRFIHHETNRAFTSVLAKKYFNGEYAAINLGRRGNGNRATIRDLYYYPDILWDMLEEIIVIFCPSGAERFDVIDDTTQDINNHNRWRTMWPNAHDAGPPITTLWESYRDTIWSDKFEILEVISNIQELLIWCKWRKAKLIVIPAFMRYYDRSTFIKKINQTITKDGNLNFIHRTIPRTLNKEVYKLVDMWPWDNMFYPNDYPTFADLCMGQETTVKWQDTHFYSYLGYGSPNKWITPCGHPSAKGHDLFAKLLYKHITENL